MPPRASRRQGQPNPSKRRRKDPNVPDPTAGPSNAVRRQLPSRRAQPARGRPNDAGTNNVTTAADAAGAAAGAAASATAQTAAQAVLRCNPPADPPTTAPSPSASGPSPAVTAAGAAPQVAGFGFQALTETIAALPPAMAAQIQVMAAQAAIAAGVPAAVSSQMTEAASRAVAAATLQEIMEREKQRGQGVSPAAAETPLPPATQTGAPAGTTLPSAVQATVPPRLEANTAGVQPPGSTATVTAGAEQQSGESAATATPNEDPEETSSDKLVIGQLKSRRQWRRPGFIIRGIHNHLRSNPIPPPGPNDLVKVCELEYYKNALNLRINAYVNSQKFADEENGGRPIPVRVRSRLDVRARVFCTDEIVRLLLRTNSGTLVESVGFIIEDPRVDEGRKSTVLRALENRFAGIYPSGVVHRHSMWLSGGPNVSDMAYYYMLTPDGRIYVTIIHLLMLQYLASAAECITEGFKELASDVADKDKFDTLMTSNLQHIWHVRKKLIGDNEEWCIDAKIPQDTVGQNLISECWNRTQAEMARFVTEKVKEVHCKPKATMNILTRKGRQSKRVVLKPEKCLSAEDLHLGWICVDGCTKAYVKHL